MAIKIIFQLAILLFFVVPAWAQFGGLGLKSEDSAHVSGDLGRPIWAVRQDSQSDFAADGDYVPLSVDGSGQLRVVGATATEYDEDDPTPATITGIANMMERDDQLSNVTPAEADWIGLRGTQKGALWVAIGDASGDPITSFGGGTEYTLGTDTYTEATTVGRMVGCVRNDTLETLASADNEIAPCQVDADGAVYVNIAAGGALTDDSAYTVTTSPVNPEGGMFDDTSPDSVDENDVGIFRMSANRNQYMTIRDAAGNERGVNVDASNNLQIDIAASSATVTVAAHAVTNAGTFATQVDGDALTALQLIDNAISGAGFNITQLAGATTPMTTTQADGLANTLDSLNVTAFNYVYNGTTFDIVREGAVAGSFLVDGTGSVFPVTNAGLTELATAIDTQMQVDIVANATDFATQTTLAAIDTDTGNILADTTAILADTAAIQTAVELIDNLRSDPCADLAPQPFRIDVTGTTTTEIINESSSNKVYICSFNIVTNAANNVALVEDATDACANPDAGVVGGVTAAEGWNFAANGGLALGSGRGTVLVTASTDMNVCIIASATTQLTGGGTYVYAP